MNNEKIADRVLEILSELRTLSEQAEDGSWIHRELLKFLDFAKNSEDVREENVNLN